jgi:hypothetical protein
MAPSTVMGSRRTVDEWFTSGSQSAPRRARGGGGGGRHSCGSRRER